MAYIQQQFEQFHSSIRADYDMNSTLREKRDNIIDLLRKRLKQAGRPTFRELMQGSYAYGVGIHPIENLEFDIDVGLRFDIDPAKYEAQEVRKWVFDAVEGHTNSVEEKGPCIRVAYSAGYHVDLVTYATQVQNEHETYSLAHRTNGWRPADPPALLQYFRSARLAFDGTEDKASNTDQLRRVVRYLKRWNDEAIPKEAEYKLSGLALLLMSVNYAKPSRLWDGTLDDLTALEQVAASASSIAGRITIRKPTPEYEDLASRVSDSEMTKLKERFARLAEACRTARAEVDPVKACQTMKAVLGRDFPVPDPKDAAKKTAGPAIVTSSASA
jgi:hypothetical protein